MALFKRKKEERENAIVETRNAKQSDSTEVPAGENTGNLAEDNAPEKEKEFVDDLLFEALLEKRSGQCC